MNKKPKRNDEILELFAGTPFQLRWLLGLKTLIHGVIKLQKDILDERDNFVVKHARIALKHIASSKNGGEASAHIRRSECDLRNRELVRAAKELMKNRESASELCGILAKRFLLSAKQIRTILQKHGVLKKRK